MIHTRKTFRTLLLLLLVLLLVNSGANAWLVQAQSDDAARNELNPQETGGSLATRFDEQDMLRVIVQLKVGQAVKSAELMTPSIHQVQRDVLREVKGGQVRVIHEYDYIPFMALEVDRAAFEALQKNPNVLGIAEDILMKPMLTQSVPLIGADDVWVEGVTGAGQVVAILDTGVDKNHPAFLDGEGKSRVVSEACYSSNNVTYGSTSLCPGGINSTADGSALPYATLVCPSGECDHGTHVAGIVAADGFYNSSPVKGVAPEAQIIAIQVFSRFDSYAQCSPNPSPCVLSYTSDQLAGLQRVYDLRNSYSIAAVNLSLGGGYYEDQAYCDFANSAYKAKVDLLKSVGIATIAASGNNGYTNGLSSPACISSVISVGATTKLDEVAYYSNAASFLDLLAPGGDYDVNSPQKAILSTIPNNSYGYMPGTSMATPHVAGAWALMKSFDSELSVDYILNVFKTTGKKILDVGGYFPRIDVFSAYKLILFPEFPITATNGSSPISVDVSWNLLENATTYQIFRNLNNDPNNAILVTSNLNTNFYADSSGTVGTIYQYWVKACNSSLCSDFYEPDPGWIGYIGTPPAPEAISASDGEFTDKVQVSWYGVGDVTRYEVYRNSENSFIDADEIGTPSTNLFDDLTAESGENYYYWVKACVIDDCSEPSSSDVGYRLGNYNVFLPLTIK